MEGIIEGILFVVGNEGIEKERLMDILEITEEQLSIELNKLKEKYLKDTSGIDLQFFANKFKLVTKKEHQVYYEKLVEIDKTTELSQSALETLAIIAYNSPITRSGIDEIRGVDSSYQLRKLLYRNLIKEAGRADLPGKPILFSVTDEFLDYLGLSSLEQLPELQEVEIEEDVITDLYGSKYKEEN